MQKELLQSEAKRLLLERCLRGESVPVAAGHIQARETTPSPESHKRLEPQSAQHGTIEDHNLTSRVKHEENFCSPTHDFAKPQPAISAKSNRKSLPRRALNRLLHLLCRFGPGGAMLRPLFHRMRGVKIGKNVWIGDDVYLDNEFPECIELEDGAMVELRSTILAHTHGSGRVVIGKNAFIGAGAVIVTSANRTLVIGEGSVIMATSLVTGSVAPYTFYGSDASKPLARITKPFTASTTYEEFITTLRPLSR